MKRPCCSLLLVPEQLGSLTKALLRVHPLGNWKRIKQLRGSNEHGGVGSLCGRQPCASGQQ